MAEIEIHIDKKNFSIKTGNFEITLGTDFALHVQEGDDIKFYRKNRSSDVSITITSDPTNAPALFTDGMTFSATSTGKVKKAAAGATGKYGFEVNSDPKVGSDPIAGMNGTITVQTGAR